MKLFRLCVLNEHSNKCFQISMEHIVFILKAENEFSKLLSSNLNLIHEQIRTSSAFFTQVYIEKLYWYFMEKNKLQSKTRSIHAHKIIFLICWIHKSKVMVVGFNFHRWLLKSMDSGNFFGSHHWETCTKWSRVCLRSLRLTSPLTRVFLVDLD